MTAEATKLARAKALAKADLAAGRQITWTLAFVTSRPTLKQMRAWFDVPANLNKADALEWLAGEALREVGEA